MKVVAAIHNNFIQKLHTRIWNLRTYDKSKWEDAINITFKLKTTPRPSNLPATSRGRVSFNPNSRKASHQKRKKDNNNSDNSSSDSENTVQQKHTRITSDNTMDKNFIADTAVDVGVDGLSSPSKENNTVLTSLSSHPNIAAVKVTSRNGKGQCQNVEIKICQNAEMPK
ncbi:hypothetical protein RclHR1_20570002 [Rhizophagus clarus]|uniref:Uncharacterized protein n=1 Tax=Rhizophagus clarus TaxID=94130 RepID=A0A2Z6QRN0_9GLOM|nr:hypothetical protein RclHR1_20570002 [Rhizophagus clarus]